MKRRVVITGMGAVEPHRKYSAQEMWQSAREGRCGIGPITHFDTTSHKVKLAGEVKDLRLADIHRRQSEPRRMDPFSQYAMVAAKQALPQDSGLDCGEDRSRPGSAWTISSGIGGHQHHRNRDTHGAGKRGSTVCRPSLSPMDISQPGSGQCGHRAGGQGHVLLRGDRLCRRQRMPSATPSAMIRDGYQDADAGRRHAKLPSHRWAIGGFTSMKAPVRPSDDPDPGFHPL